MACILVDMRQFVVKSMVQSSSRQTSYPADSDDIFLQNFVTCT